MAGKFKIGDEVITKYDVWPYRRQLIGKITGATHHYERGRYHYTIKFYEDGIRRDYYAVELNKYINNINDLL